MRKEVHLTLTIIKKVKANGATSYLTLDDVQKTGYVLIIYLSSIDHFLINFFLRSLITAILRSILQI